MLRAVAKGQQAPQRLGAVIAGKGDRLGSVPRRVGLQLRGIWGRRTRSSRIRRNIRVEPTAKGVEVFVDPADIGFNPLFEEDDTRPHLILPRQRKVLRWIGPDGEPVFRPRANHRGTKGSHALRQARLVAGRILKDETRVALVG